MNHTICSINKWPLLAGLVLCAACSESTDLEGVSGSLDNQAKLVVVDYAVGEPELRSVSHEPLPANQRISSLTYLLYDAEGSLVKQREIPDINTTTVWPLKRTTMTWAQREALRDTLKCGDKYTSVFVANANPKLFANEEVLHLTKLVDAKPIPVKLSEVFLSLPRNTAFHDGNMFYLDVNNIKPDTQFDREHPLNCPVMLERIVSRTDFFSDDFPAWNSEFAQGKIQEFADKVYGEYFPVELSNNPFHVNDMLKNFTQDFYNYTYHYTLIPGEGAIYAAWLADFARNVNTLICKDAINNAIQTADIAAIKDIFYDAIRKNESLEKLWQPWSGLTAKVTYSKCADLFFIDGLKSGVNAEENLIQSPMLDMIMLDSKVPGAKKQHTFTLIGFGENANTVSKSEQNIMQEVQLYSKDNNAALVATLPLPDAFRSFSAQGKNGRVQLVYCPIKALVVDKEEANKISGVTYNLPPINLEVMLPSSLFASQLYMKRLQEFFESDKGKKYGTDMQNFILQITLPDLSQSKALKVESGWTQKQ